MADTYSKLLGLSETNAPSSESGKSQPAQTPIRKANKTSKLANQQTSKEGNKAKNQPANSPDYPTRKSAISQDTTLLSTKEKTKYGTYLTDESIQKIRIRAAETNRADHQVLQEIINQYFEKLAK